jgi:hypothetical protein
MTWPLIVAPGLVFVAAAASLYLWYLIAESTLLDKPLGGVRERWPMLIGCPWCAGFWITGLVLIGAGLYDPFTHVAAAGLVGLAGSHAA